MKTCPICQSEKCIKSGIINNKQRYKCKDCGYHFTVFSKLGKKIDEYYVNKALQLYIEGLGFREIERILGVSHVSISNWVKKYQIKRPTKEKVHPTYKILNSDELVKYISDTENIKGAGVIITEIGKKFLLIQWKPYKNN